MVAGAGPKWDEEDPNSEFRSVPFFPWDSLSD